MRQSWMDCLSSRISAPDLAITASGRFDAPNQVADTTTSHGCRFYAPNIEP